ncbi:hypothetical protein [Facklamia sp. P9177]|uniref:hypothetical protein n=1 Tax=Facklamia sp. P9177 TaxID=3421945 RepID=UPI003D170FCF
MSLEDFNFELGAFNQRKKKSDEQRLYEIWIQERVVNVTDDGGKFRYSTFKELLGEDEKTLKKRQVFSELKEIARRKKELENLRKEET